MSIVYPISEVFSSIQGEGINTGVPSIFIRFAGCNLNCIFCDSLAKGTPVLTDGRGWISIEDVKEGEFIIGVVRESNHPLQNRWFYKKAVAQSLVSHSESVALKITTNSKNTITCTTNHQILVQRKNSKSNNGTINKKWQWVAAKDIEKGDILWSIGFISDKYVDLKETSDYIEGWISGYDKGDGGWSNSSKKCRRYDSIDPLLLDRLGRYLESLEWNYKRRTYQIKTGTVYQLDSKYIPLTDISSVESIEWKRGFIAGFFDAEGSNNHSLLCISVQDLDVLKKIESWLIHSFEFSVAISGRNERDGCYKLTIFGGVLERLRFDAIFKYAKIGHHEIWLWEKAGRRGKFQLTKHRQAKIKTEVIEIERIEKTISFYDINSSCGNFIANGIVVHNTPYTWNWKKTSHHHVDNVKFDPVNEIVKMSVEEVSCKVFELSNNQPKKWAVVITGGEPLMYGESLIFLVKELAYKYRHIEIETNGTFIPHPSISKLVSEYNVSPKLESSGVSLDKRENPNAFFHFAGVLCAKSWFKFVVCSSHDMKEILQFVEDYDVIPDRVMLMPEGRTQMDLDGKALHVIDLCKEHGFRYCPRLQIQLFGNKRGV